MTTQKICILAIGIALFVVLSLCLQVPVFENYYLCLGYVVMAVYCFSFGPLYGTIVGFFGVILYCILINGLRGMPGWVTGNIVIGIFVGLSCKLTKRCKSNILRYVIIFASVVFSSLIGILGVKSAVECVLYSQPFALRTVNNIYAFTADVFVLIFSLPVCHKMHQFLYKLFPKIIK